MFLCNLNFSSDPRFSSDHLVSSHNQFDMRDLSASSKPNHNQLDHTSEKNLQTQKGYNVKII